MKAHTLVHASFCTLVASRSLLILDLYLFDRDNANAFNYTTIDDAAVTSSELATAVTAADSKWDQAVLSGGNLWAGMHSDDRKASFLFKTDPHTHDPTIQSVQSVFDGDMVELFRKWGYNEDDAKNAKIDKECDFDKYHKIKRAFDELGINSESKGNGGPNQCVNLDHQGGPKVVRDKEDKLPPIYQQKYIDDSCGKEYRVTGANFEFGVNGKDGMVTLINVISPGYSAQRLWQQTPASHELPQIRSISDVAWGFWNRAAAGDLGNIKYLMVAMIMNEDTRSIIRQAHETLTPKRSETAVWPGYDFPMDTSAGQAILGSPVGRWAGYFLMQHKKQLGGNKFISKVRVFKPDAGSLPYMLFYADGLEPEPSPSPSPEPQARAAREVIDIHEDEDKVFSQVEVRTVKRSKDGRSIQREHVFRVLK